MMCVCFNQLLIVVLQDQVMFFYGNLCYYYFFYMSVQEREGKFELMTFALLCVVLTD
jgi:hypothetical protein